MKSLITDVHSIVNVRIFSGFITTITACNCKRSSIAAMSLVLEGFGVLQACD